MGRERRSSNSFYIMCVSLLVLIYVWMIWKFSCHLPDAVGWISIEEQKAIFSEWKNFLCYCSSSLLAVLSFILFILGMRNAYMLSSVFLVHVLFFWMSEFTFFSETVAVTLAYSIFLGIAVWLFPLADRLLGGSVQFRAWYLILAVMLTLIFDGIVLFCPENYFYLWSGYCFIFRAAFLICMAVVTLGFLRASSVEKIFTGIVFTLAITCVPVIGLLATHFKNPIYLTDRAYYLAYIVEFSLLFFLLIDFLVIYFLSKPIQNIYLLFMYLLVIGSRAWQMNNKHIISVYEGANFPILNLLIVLLLAFETVYLFWIKRKNKVVTLQNSILMLLFLYIVLFSDKLFFHLLFNGFYFLSILEGYPQVKRGDENFIFPVELYTFILFFIVLILLLVNRLFREKIFVKITFVAELICILLVGFLAADFGLAVEYQDRISYLAYLVEFFVLIFLLINFFTVYAFSKSVQQGYLLFSYLLVVWKECIFFVPKWILKIYQGTSYQLFGFCTDVLLIFLTISVCLKKEKRTVVEKED